jgi:DivIVA domain-containing protein
MSTNPTRLLTGTALTPADIRGADFPMAIIGGYRTADVEAFRTRVYNAIGQLHRALEERAVTEQELNGEIQRLTRHLESGAPSADVQAGAQSAVRVLAIAQQNADNLLTDARTEAARIAGEARHQAEQLMARVQQEAVQLREQAHAAAEEERTQIIEQASAEGRMVASGFRTLSEEMSAGVVETLETLAKKVAEWDQRARAAQAPARPAAPRRRSGPQPQASAKPA